MSTPPIPPNDLSAVERMFERILQVSTRQSTYEAMGFTLQQLSMDCFRDSRDPYGNPWQRLAASTLRKRRGTSAQILVDTGALRQSVTYRAANNNVALGSNLAYAAIHQFGGRAGRNRSATIPRRAYLPFDATGNANLPAPWERQCIDVIEAEAARVIP